MGRWIPSFFDADVQLNTSFRRQTDSLSPHCSLLLLPQNLKKTRAFPIPTKPGTLIPMGVVCSRRFAVLLGSSLFGCHPVYLADNNVPCKQPEQRPLEFL